MAGPGSQDVPTTYDVVFSGGSLTQSTGFVFADSIEPSLPFRTHRAIYDISPTFIQRSNVTSAYGDNMQDYWLTFSQNDWSLGEDEKYFRIGDATKSRQFWKGVSAEINLPGQVTLQTSPVNVTASTGASATVSCAGNVLSFAGSESMLTVSATNLIGLGPDGAVYSHGAHSLTTAPTTIAYDGQYAYVAADQTSFVRSYNGLNNTWATFNGAVASTSSSGASSLAFLNNALYGLRRGVLYRYDSTGAATALPVWKNAQGAAVDPSGSLSTVLYDYMFPYGGKMILVRNIPQQSGAELWTYDGVGFTKIDEYPQSFYPVASCVVQGIIFTVGYSQKGSNLWRSEIRYFANGTSGLAWSSDHYSSGTVYAGHAICTYGSGCLFTDNVDATVRYYDLSNGSISTVFSYTPQVGRNTVFLTPEITPASAALLTQTASTAVLYGGSAGSVATSACVTSSLIDFEASLPKTFRSAICEFDAATDGNGGSVDLYYRVNDLNGAYTLLQAGVTSGTEVSFAASTSGRSLSVKTILGRGTSTSGPTLKRLYVRAAPKLQQFRSGTYIFECSPNRTLRNGMPHPLSGKQQASALLSAAQSSVPFTCTDRFGSFSALIDINDPDGFDLYEIHPPGEMQTPATGGTYFGRIKVREV